MMMMIIIIMFLFLYVVLICLVIKGGYHQVKNHTKINDWSNKGRGMYYPVCGDDAYKRTLAANRKE